MTTGFAVTQLSRRFGGLLALADLSFETCADEIFGIIGPNGAGKSTLFNVMAGAWRPSSGAVYFGGQRLSGLRGDAIARAGVARTFQSPMLFGDCTVQENLRRAALFGRIHSPWAYLRQRLGGAARVSQPAWFDEALELTGLSAQRQRVAGELPYGQQKAVGVAMALAQCPRVLLMDEPAAGLNSSEKADMAATITRIRAQRGIHVLVVEHDMKLIMGICDRILVISQGRFVALGTPQEVRNDPLVIDAYLGEDHVFA